MAGLKRLLKGFGRMKMGDVVWVYDYANEEAVKESEMPTGSERWKASEKAKYESLANNVNPYFEDKHNDLFKSCAKDW